MPTASEVERPVGVTAAVDIADRFKAAFRRHPGGVAVITADAGDGPVALTVTSVASVSAEPALLVFSVSELSSATPTILASDRVVVHLLEASRADLARLAATSGVDRFADQRMWSRFPDGEPFYVGVDNWLRCEIVNRVAAGGSTLIVARVLEAGSPATADVEPLVYVDRTWHRLSAASHLAD